MTSSQIIEVVARAHGVTVSNVRDHCNRKEIVAARHEIFYRLSHEKGMSAASIGRVVGGERSAFHHTTVLNGISRFKAKQASIPVPLTNETRTTVSAVDWAVRNLEDKFDRLVGVMSQHFTRPTLSASLVPPQDVEEIDTMDWSFLTQEPATRC